MVVTTDHKPNRLVQLAQVKKLMAFFEQGQSSTQ